jgi:hypothetical protein
VVDKPEAATDPPVGEATDYSTTIGESCPGNFIAQQPREGLSEVAIAVLDEMSRDGYLARLDVEPDGSYRVLLVPVSGNPDGLPEVVEGALRESIAERLVRLSARLDTEVSREGENIFVQCAGTRAGK